MKGTAKTPENDSDIQQAMLTLQNDEKNKAENTMIVDLLRNDLSKIAKPQSVEVLQAFDVENFGKVLQMTTTIKAKLKEKCSIVDILSAMFPCGSITGMPKRMVMSAIESLESQERGIYTGSLGYLYQKQGRVQGKLNVAIRSLEIADNKAKFGVGGGITIDSQADDEWQECQTKMAFLTQPPEFSIFETLAIKNGDIQYFNAHYQRLKQASEDLYFPELPSMNELKSKIIHQQSGIQDARLKIVHSQKSTDILIYPLQDLQGQQFCMIHTETLETNQSLRRYKTTWRDFYDAAWQFAEEHGAFDALVFNHQQQLLEGGRSNVFVKIKGKWKTPALSLDILNGIMRQKIIADPQLIGALSIEETIITRDDFAHAEEIILTNSLRGIIPVKLKEKP